jgi:hypothetical protein
MPIKITPLKVIIQEEKEKETSCKAGTELKNMLRLLGIKATPDCICTDRAMKIDANGCDWAEENHMLIVFWLSEEASKRRLPAPLWALKILVRWAIRRARKKANAV